MREKILKVASDEINKKGTSFRMDDLAHELNISKRTLYEHFSSKREIVEVIIAEKIDDVYEQHQVLLADSSLSVEEKLARYFTIRSRIHPLLQEYTLSEFLRKMPDLMENVKNSCQKDWDLLLQFMEKAKGEGHIKNYDMNVVNDMLKGTMMELFNQKKELFEKDNERLHSVMKAAVDIIWNGIGIDGGRTIHE